MKPIIVIAGPTASGKSKLALYLANKYNGIIINIDALQLYKYIPVISAQPSEEDCRNIEHKLYSILEPSETCSVGKFLKLAMTEIESAFSKRKIPILIGGTGLYIRSLIYGLVNIPEIETDIREEVRNLYFNVGIENFYNYLISIDPKTTGKIRSSDSQRMIRALEVFKQTGISIIEWQNTKPIIHYDLKRFKQIVLMPERAYLYNNCNERFINMIKCGAIEEVERLRNNYTDINAVSKAIGVPEITSYIKNEIDMVQLIALGQQKTRNYAKRQITWFKHQLPHAKLQAYNNFEEILNLIDKEVMVEISH